MRSLLLIIATAVFPIDAIAQQCRADFNGNGATEVGEVVTAVNEVLNGCGGGGNRTPTRTPPRPTPTRTPTTPPVDACPFDFNDSNIGDTACNYTGPATSPCNGTFPIAGAWQSDGDLVIAVLLDNTGSIGIAATRTSATAARVTSISPGPDFSQTFSATGNLGLPGPRRFNASFSTADRCIGLAFQGTYDRLFATSADVGTIGALTQPLAPAAGIASEQRITAELLLERFAAQQRERH